MAFGCHLYGCASLVYVFCKYLLASESYMISLLSTGEPLTLSEVSNVPSVDLSIWLVACGRTSKVDATYAHGVDVSWCVGFPVEHK